MGALYLTTGTLHFIHTQTYLAIMPPYIPAHHFLVSLTGVAEIAGGLGILTPIPAVQRAAAWGLVALLIAVMPANIYMVTNQQNFPTTPLWALWLRLPLQLLLIYWAWRYTRTRMISA
jgi:uncharacterized membrane protein